MTAGEPPGTPPPSHVAVRELVEDPQVRELLADVLAEELEARRQPSLWKRVRPWLAGVASAAVTVLAFFVPSLQEQWDRFQARTVIQSYVRMGRDFMQEARYDLAEQTFAKAFELSESRRLDIEVERLEARVAQVNADPEWGKENPEALQESDFLYLLHFQKGSGRARQRALTFNSYGVFLAAEGRPAEADSMLRASVRLDPGNASAHLHLGNLLSDGGRAAAAEAEYRRAIALAPRLASAHYDLGLLLAEEHRVAAAESLLRQAAALAPGDPDSRRSLADLLEESGRGSEAAALRLQAERLAAAAEKVAAARRATAEKEKARKDASE